MKNGNLRLTIKVKSENRTENFYDVGVRRFEDPRNVLSEMTVVGSVDSGYYLADEDNVKLWYPKHVEVSRPRYLEDFLRNAKEVSILEYGRYLEQKEAVDTIISMMSK